MESITSLEQLHHNLTMGPGYEGYTELVKAIDLPRAEYQHLLKWSKAHYQRIRFYDTDCLEALITCWEPGQIGKIHNFEGANGWVKVLEGSLELEHFNLDNSAEKPSLTKTFKTGEIGFLNDGLGFHRFNNPTQERGVALFFYADKIDHWQVYDPNQKKAEKVEAKVDFNLDRISS